MIDVVYDDEDLQALKNRFPSSLGDSFRELVANAIMMAVATDVISRLPKHTSQKIVVRGAANEYSY